MPHDVTTDPPDDRPDVFRETADGTIALLPSTSRSNGWILLVDGDSQSYVDLDDPGYLHLVYARGVAAILDAALPARPDLRTVHVGGALMALPRYLADRHAGSSHVVAEPNTDLLELVDEYVPLPAGGAITVEARFGEDVVAGEADDAVDLVVLDAFVNGSTVPESLRSAGFVADVARVLRPGGLFVANLIDWTGLGISTPLAGLTATGIGPTARYGSPGLLDGTDEGGTILLVAAAGPLDVDAVTASVTARSPFRPVTNGVRPDS